MTQMDANIRTRRVASIIKRSCSDDFAFDSVRVIQVKDLFSSLVSLKCSSPGQNCFISGQTALVKTFIIWTTIKWSHKHHQQSVS